MNTNKTRALTFLVATFLFFEPKNDTETPTNMIFVGNRNGAQNRTQNLAIANYRRHPFNILIFSLFGKQFEGKEYHTQKYQDV